MRAGREPVEKKIDGKERNAGYVGSYRLVGIPQREKTLARRLLGTTATS